MALTKSEDETVTRIRMETYYQTLIRIGELIEKSVDSYYTLKLIERMVAEMMRQERERLK